MFRRIKGKGKDGGAALENFGLAHGDLGDIGQAPKLGDFDVRAPSPLRSLSRGLVSCIVSHPEPVMLHWVARGLGECLLALCVSAITGRGELPFAPDYVGETQSLHSLHGNQSKMHWRRLLVLVLSLPDPHPSPIYPLACRHCADMPLRLTQSLAIFDLSLRDSSS